MWPILAMPCLVLLLEAAIYEVIEFEIGTYLYPLLRLEFLKCKHFEMTSLPGDMLRKGGYTQYRECCLSLVQIQ